MSVEALFSALSAFTQPMLDDTETLTANGALTNAVVDLSGKREGLMGLFYKSVRGVTDDMLFEYLEKSVSEDVISAILIVFYIRDCRGGKGERDIARKCFKYLLDKPNRELLYKVLHKIPEYGRWDDLILLSEQEECRNAIYKILVDQLKTDILTMKENKPISLLAKWMPTEKHKLDKQLNFVTNFCKYNKSSPKNYRRTMSSLRRHLDILERKICNGEWSIVDYSTVPSCAMQKLKKAFAKHDSDRFEEWKNKLSNPNEKVKVNAGQLFPYEVVKDYFPAHEKDALLEAQWKVLVDQLKSSKGPNNMHNSLVVCDVSGSMECGGSKIVPIHVAISLSILLSEVTAEPFTNKVITFSEKPVFFNLNASSLFDKIQLLRKAPWDMNTDLQSVFNLVLHTANAQKTKNENMPKRIIIISDMQFDSACTANNKTNYQNIKRTYHRYGFDMPQLVFWNVNGSSDDFPVQIRDNGTILLSGFSARIVRDLLDGNDITPWNIVENVLSNSRYQELKTLMES